MSIQHADKHTGSMQSAGKSQEARLLLLERRMRGNLPSPQRLSFDGPDLGDSGRQVRGIYGSLMLHQSCQGVLRQLVTRQVEAAGVTAGVCGGQTAEWDEHGDKGSRDGFGILHNSCSRQGKRKAPPPASAGDLHAHTCAARLQSQAQETCLLGPF